MLIPAPFKVRRGPTWYRVFRLNWKPSPYYVVKTKDGIESLTIPEGV